MNKTLYSLAMRPPVNLEYRMSYGRYGEHCNIGQFFTGLSVASPDSNPYCTIPSRFSNLVLWQQADIAGTSGGCTEIVDCAYRIQGAAPLRKARTKIRGCPCRLYQTCGRS